MMECGVQCVIEAGLQKTLKLCAGNLDIRLEVRTLAITYTKMVSQRHTYISKCLYWFTISFFP